jgi:hypothetical protein
MSRRPLPKGATRAISSPMAHPLEDVIRGADGFLLIGDSSTGRFPATSFHSYTKVGKRFFCLDLGGLTESRGASAGHRVYTSVADLPEARADLAVIWVKPGRSVEAVDAAHEAGCKRIWFSFQTGHRDAVARAAELGLEVVEIGRCPVYYMDEMTPTCRAHTLLIKASGSYRKPPQTQAGGKKRELW